MNKKLFYFVFAFVFFFTIIAALQIIKADDPVPYELAQTEYSVPTSIGNLNIQAGSLIGGSPTNYILLTEETIMETTMGTRTLNAGTKVKCGEPGQPPCNPY